MSRYYNVIAYDHSRVIVHHDDEEIYINASLVKVPQADREYILAQGEVPLNLCQHSWNCHFQDLLKTRWMTSG